jgi:hypothetical protein
VKLIGWLFRLLILLVALGALVVFGARLLDGPVGPIPGGPLSSGEWVERDIVDWSFAKNVATVELQLVSQPISRTTWILVRDGGAWIPCSLGYPPGKTWYKEAEKDGRAVLRISGRRYAVMLARDEDPTLPDFALDEVKRKYGNPPPSDAGVAFFRVTARAR